MLKNTDAERFGPIRKGQSVRIYIDPRTVFLLEAARSSAEPGRSGRVAIERTDGCANTRTHGLTMLIPAFVRKAYPQPLILRDALDIVYASADVSDTTKPALKSTAIDAVRYATRNGDGLPSKSDVLGMDIRPLLSVLPAAARVAGEAKGHRNPGDHEARARRFVEALTGGRTVSGSNLRCSCRPSWQPLVDAISDRKNANGEMSFIDRCCVVAGFQDAPVRMPSPHQLIDAARQLNGDKGVRRITKSSMPQYRTARQRLLDAASTDEERDRIATQFAYLPTLPSPRTCHLGVEPATVEMLKEAGCFRSDLSPEQMFRALAPALAEDYDYWAKGPGALLSASFRQQCFYTLLRVAGWVVRAGHGAHLRDMQLLDFYLEVVPLDDREPTNPRLAKRLGDQDTGRRLVSLLEASAEGEAETSLLRSTVTDAELAGLNAEGKPWFTEAVHANCSRLWTMTADVYREMSAHGGQAAKDWALIESRWGRLHRELTDRKLPAQYRIFAKDKLRMVQTVTLPQLVCVGMPLRRREVRALREEWIAALQQAKDAGHNDPATHPHVVEIADRYFEAAVQFTILSLAVDDGLRSKQYTRGRLGTSANFRIELEFDADGTPFGIASMTTHWSGDKRSAAHLKIREKDKVVARREDRTVRRGFVDHVVLWDVVRHWRPRQLVANGSVADLSSYDLLSDLKEGEFALIPSARDVDRSEKSRTDISESFGKELHYIVRTWLRPELPHWDELGREWRGLWAIHISRLLLGSYWGGARDLWRVASYLTMDTESTLRAEYSRIDEGLSDRLGLDKTNWEHLNAYDPWMDRLYYNYEEFDPVGDPDLPLPPHLQGRLPEGPTALPKKARIRRARPGQKPPKR